MTFAEKNTYILIKYWCGKVKTVKYAVSVESLSQTDVQLHQHANTQNTTNTKIWELQLWSMYMYISSQSYETN